jgi:hypothetical protein
MMWRCHCVVAVAWLVVCAACAQQRSPIDRVQPNVIRKADLDGEWYFQQTVIDLDTSANYSVVGDNAFWSMERIRWDIQENYLYARRSFEWVENSDNTDFTLDEGGARYVGATASEDGQAYLGAVVAAFRIDSHFDIIREYNPTTGEELNVIGENTTDRPWHDRLFMRVDWSENLATDFDFDYFYYAHGELNVDPIPFYVQENGPEEYRPVFARDEEGDLEYFDVVQQVAVHPATVAYRGREYPVCWFMEGVDCSTTILTVRSSFLQVNEQEEDYEPFEFKGAITETFGFWTVDRMRYNHRQGFREYSRRRYAQLHNLWQRSHRRPEELSKLSCGDVSDCPGQGAICQQGQCTYGFCQNDDECGQPRSRCDTNVGVQIGLCASTWDDTHYEDECEEDDDCRPLGLGSRCDYRRDNLVGQCTIPEAAPYSTRSCDVDEQCGSESRCLVAGRCTIPFAQRQPKPVVYYLTGGWPEDLEQVRRTIEMDFDAALRRSVAAAQGHRELDLRCSTDADCYIKGTSCIDDKEHPRQGWCSMPVRQMFYLCHSPVRASDPAECGERGLTVRLGDIRYNALHYSREWNPLSPLGQTPIAPDPFSGRIFGATVTLYDAIDAVAYRYLERAMLLNGTLDPQDFIDGVNLQHWVASLSRRREAEGRQLDQDELLAMYQARDIEWMKRLKQSNSDGHGPEGFAHADNMLPQMLQHVRDNGAFDADRDPGDSFLYSLHRTPIEALMMNDEMLMAANYPPGTPLTEEVLSQASLASPEFALNADAREAWFQEHNWGRNIFYADLADVSVEALAREIKGMEEEEAYQLLRLRTWHSVITHELGHSFGLFHNFAGSEDTVNFPEEWWAVRTDDFSRTPGPRFLDPMTDDEINGGLFELGYSSVMDYNANYASQETLGSYDRAAILFGYGRSIEVYRQLSGGLSHGDMAEYWSSGGSFLRFFGDRMDSKHYTEMYNLMGRKLFAQSNRMIVPVDGLSEDLMGWFDPDDDDGEQYTRVPYLYCNDYRADLGENCHRWDFGFDVYDRMQYYIEQDDWNYLTRNFRRGNINGDVYGFVRSAYRRYYKRFKQIHDYYNLIDSLCHTYYDDASCEEFMTDPRRGFGGYTAAINDGFNLLARTLTRPDVANYEPLVRSDGSTVYGDSGWIRDNQVELPVVDGRHFTTSWWSSQTEDCGVHFWECLHHYGFYFNKLMALMVLSEAETFFVARDTAEDVRMWRISYFDDYAPQIIDLLGGIMAEDYEAIAPYLEPAAADGLPPELTLRNYALPDADVVPNGALPVDPFTGFTVQLYAAVLGFARLHTNFDNRFITSARLWTDGGDHGVTAPADCYEDPETLLVYCAIAHPDGQGIAQRMVAHANDLRARSTFCDVEPGQRHSCVAGLSADARARATKDMALYRDQLDVMVHLTARYDNWSFSYGDPFNPGDVPSDW